MNSKPLYKSKAWLLKCKKIFSNEWEAKAFERTYQNWRPVTMKINLFLQNLDGNVL